MFNYAEYGWLAGWLAHGGGVVATVAATWALTGLALALVAIPRGRGRRHG